MFSKVMDVKNLNKVKHEKSLINSDFFAFLGICEDCMKTRSEKIRYIVKILLGK